MFFDRSAGTEPRTRRSQGRLISGFARGILREYQVHNVPLAESRARFEEAYDIITRAWTEEVFSYQGLSLGITAYIADSKARALKEYGPHILYFNRTLFSHGNFIETEKQRESGYTTQTSTDYVRPENLRAAANLRSEFRNLTMPQLAEQAEQMPMGTADEVVERIIDAAESAGANQVQIAMNRGALPHDLFMAQIERFAREVLPRLQAHEVKRVPAAEEAMA